VRTSSARICSRMAATSAMIVPLLARRASLREREPRATGRVQGWLTRTRMQVSARFVRACRRPVRARFWLRSRAAMPPGGPPRLVRSEVDGKRLSTGWRITAGRSCGRSVRCKGHRVRSGWDHYVSATLDGLGATHRASGFAPSCTGRREQGAVIGLPTCFMRPECYFSYRSPISRGASP
jgi:hypothetical protein